MMVSANIENGMVLIDKQYIDIYSDPKRTSGTSSKGFSDKGLYYFDADDGTKLGVCSFHEYYTKHSCPQKPLKYELLPERIREILKYNFMEIEDFSLANTIYVKHAYE